MTKRKSPGGNQGKNQESGEWVGSLYPAAAAPVKEKVCRACRFFREVPGARWKRIFCAFSGEAVTERWTCEFWEPGGGGV